MRNEIPNVSTCEFDSNSNSFFFLHLACVCAVCLPATQLRYSAFWNLCKKKKKIKERNRKGFKLHFLFILLILFCVCRRRRLRWCNAMRHCQLIIHIRSYLVHINFISNNMAENRLQGFSDSNENMKKEKQNTFSFFITHRHSFIRVGCDTHIQKNARKIRSKNTHIFEIISFCEHFMILWRFMQWIYKYMR